MHTDHLPRIPVLRADTILARVDETRWFIGPAPGRLALLSPASESIVGWLRCLDGRWDLGEALLAAPTSVGGALAAAALLDQLDRLGMLAEGKGTPRALGDMVLTPTSDIRAAERRWGARGALAVVDARRRRSIGVSGPAWITQPVVRSLQECGVRRARVQSDPGAVERPDLLVVTTEGGMWHDIAAVLPDRADGSAAPHLAVIVDPVGARMSSFVVAGRGPCLSCHALSDIDADPSWAFLAKTRPHTTAGAVAPHHRDLLVSAIVSRTLHAVDELLQHDPADPDSVTGMRLDVRFDGPTLDYRTIRRHPCCRCRPESSLETAA